MAPLLIAYLIGLVLTYCVIIFPCIYGCFYEQGISGKLVLRQLPDDIVIHHGNHETFKKGHCAMEIVAWLAGEGHGDHPDCCCSVLGAFVRRWNDDLPDDTTRTRLLRPILPRLVGTRSTPKVESARAWLATDWLVRVYTPAFLRLVPVLKGHAEALSTLPPITTTEAAQSAQRDIGAAGNAARNAAENAAENAAGDAALAAAENAAWNAARNAARNAAWNAAENAAWNAAWAAAGNAAWAAAGNAARNAAWAAALAAAGDAARDALRPTVERLQASAVDLLERMIEVAA